MEIDAKSPNGNAWCIMGHVRNLLEAADRASEIPEVMTRMKSGDYQNLCKVAKEVTRGSIVVINLDSE